MVVQVETTMPFRALEKPDVDADTIIPFNATSGETYYCPECFEEYTVVKAHHRRNSYVSKHFRTATASDGGATTAASTHSTGCGIGTGGGESDLHYKLKSLTAEAFDDFYGGEIDCREEFRLNAPLSGKKHRDADVAVTFDTPHETYGKGIVAEIQVANKDKDLYATTLDFLAQDYSVVWLSPADFTDEALKYEKTGFENLLDGGVVDDRCFFNCLIAEGKSPYPSAATVHPHAIEAKVRLRSRDSTVAEDAIAEVRETTSKPQLDIEFPNQVFIDALYETMPIETLGKGYEWDPRPEKISEELPPTYGPDKPTTIDLDYTEWLEQTGNALAFGKYNNKELVVCIDNEDVHDNDFLDIRQDDVVGAGSMTMSVGRLDDVTYMLTERGAKCLKEKKRKKLRQKQREQAEKEREQRQRKEHRKRRAQKHRQSLIGEVRDNKTGRLSDEELEELTPDWILSKYGTTFDKLPARVVSQSQPQRWTVIQKFLPMCCSWTEHDFLDSSSSYSPRCTECGLHKNTLEELGQPSTTTSR